MCLVHSYNGNIRYLILCSMRTNADTIDSLIRIIMDMNRLISHFIK